MYPGGTGGGCHGEDRGSGGPDGLPTDSGTRSVTARAPEPDVDAPEVASSAARAAVLGVVGALLVVSGCYGLPTVPSSVTGLAATSTPTSVTLSWSNPSFMWGVRIYRAEGLTPPPVPGLGTAPGSYHADLGDRTSYTDTGLTTGATYTYAVVVYGADGYYSSPAVITVRPGAVSPPATFAAPMARARSRTVRPRGVPHHADAPHAVGFVVRVHSTRRLGASRHRRRAAGMATQVRTLR